MVYLAPCRDEPRLQQTAKAMIAIERFHPRLAAVDGLKAAGYYDKSDAMTDYFDTAYYFHLNVGQWDKPYIVTPHTMRQAAAALTEKAIKAKIAAQGCSADFINNQLIIKVIA